MPREMTSTRGTNSIDMRSTSDSSGQLAKSFPPTSLPIPASHIVVTPGLGASRVASQSCPSIASTNLPARICQIVERATRYSDLGKKATRNKRINIRNTKEDYIIEIWKGDLSDVVLTAESSAPNTISAKVRNGSLLLRYVADQVTTLSKVIINVEIDVDGTVENYKLHIYII